MRIFWLLTNFSILDFANIIIKSTVSLIQIRIAEAQAHQVASLVKFLVCPGARLELEGHDSQRSAGAFSAQHGIFHPTIHNQVGRSARQLLSARLQTCTTHNNAISCSSADSAPVFLVVCRNNSHRSRDSASLQNMLVL